MSCHKPCLCDSCKSELEAQLRGTDQTSLLAPSEIQELFGSADPTLLGNRIAALTKSLGIPPCGGCSGRQDWINRAHAAIRDEIDRLIQ